MPGAIGEKIVSQSKSEVMGSIVFGLQARGLLSPVSCLTFQFPIALKSGQARLVLVLFASYHTICCHANSGCYPTGGKLLEVCSEDVNGLSQSYNYTEHLTTPPTPDSWPCGVFLSISGINKLFSAWPSQVSDRKSAFLLFKILHNICKLHLGGFQCKISK